VFERLRHSQFTEPIWQLCEWTTIVDPNLYAATGLWIADAQAGSEGKRPVSSR